MMSFSLLAFIVVSSEDTTIRIMLRTLKQPKTRKERAPTFKLIWAKRVFNSFEAGNHHRMRLVFYMPPNLVFIHS